MANTLKFGNGEWAVKEGSALAYNDENGNFKPLPFDFTRASTATYVAKDGLIKTAASGEPRIDFLDSTEGSLLLESQRTNAITDSEDFSAASWLYVTGGTASAVAVTTNYATSPDGSQNATRLVFDLGGGTTSTDRAVIRQSISSETDWYLSAWMKSTDGTDQKILWHVGGDENETTITGDWARYTFDRNGASNGWAGLAIRGSESTVDTADILVYGFQAEQGSHPTSLINTSGTAVTRVGETCNNAGNDQVINSTEGVLYAEIAALNSTSSSSQYISISDGTYNNRASILFSNGATNQIRTFLRVGGTPQIDVSNNVSDVTDFNKVAFLYKENDFKVYINGSLVSSDTNGSVWSANTITKLSFSEINTSANKFEGKVKDLKLYNTELTDQELINLTTL